MVKLHVKICMASRREDRLVSGLRDVCQIRMQDWNQPTIRNYAEASLNGATGFLVPSQLDNLIEEIIAGSQGVILWTQFVCAELIKGLA